MKIVHVITSLQKAAGTTTFVENVVAAQKHMGHDAIVVQHPCEFCEADAFHIHGLWSSLLHKASVYARQHHIHVTWSTHGMTAPWSFRHKWWKKYPAWWLYQRHDLELAQCVHSTSLAELQWNSHLGFKNQVLVPLGTNVPDECASVNLNVRPTILFVGRIYPVKALDRLITAFQKIDHQDWVLRIVGPDQAGHEAVLRKISGTDICFAGPKYGEDLYSEYRNCEYLALVSHTENFGATVIDALAYGRPVLTSTNTPWEEVARNNCGWWVSNDIQTLSDTLEKMISLGFEERRAMGERGRALVRQKYSWPVLAEKLTKSYR